jgi:YD repeat-containing protein
LGEITVPGPESDYIQDGGQRQAPERNSEHLYSTPQQRGDGYRTTDGAYVNGASSPRELPSMQIAMADRVPAQRQQTNDGQQAAPTDRQQSPERRAEATKPAETQWKFTDKEYGQALQTAAAEGKPIILKVGTEWCGPCNKMKEHTLTDASVQKNLKDKAVFMDVDADRAAGLAEGLGVNSYPTTVLAAVRKNEQGQLELQKIGAKPGYMDAQAMNGFIDAAAPIGERAMQANGFNKPNKDGAPEKTQQEAADKQRQEQREAGEVKERRMDKRPDGSSVEYSKFADGKERPTNVAFPDGTHVSYGYDRQGRLNETRDFDAQNKETLHYKTADGVNWSESEGRGIGLQGNLSVKPDGTHVFKDSVVGNTFIRKPDGSVSLLDSTGAVTYSRPAMQRKQ